jgi:hypothetical protein
VDADALWAALKADRTLDGKDASGKKKAVAQAPASVTPSPAATVSGSGVGVAVYNGTTVGSLATRAASTLTAHDFTVTGTARARTQDHTTTLIEYGPGRESAARTVARLFPGAWLESVTAPGISLVLGQAYADAPTATASATPTTVPSSVANGARSADDNPCSYLTYG